MHNVSSAAVGFRPGVWPGTSGGWESSRGKDDKGDLQSSDNEVVFHSGKFKSGDMDKFLHCDS